MKQTTTAAAVNAATTTTAPTMTVEQAQAILANPEVASALAIVNQANRPQRTTKMMVAEDVFRAMVSEGKTRQEILAAFTVPVEQGGKIGLTADGASTYYAKLKQSTGLAGAQSVRAPRAGASTTTAADGSTTTKAGGKAGGKRTAKAATDTSTSAPAQFSVVMVDANNMITDSKPFYSSLTAVKQAAETKGIAVIGAAQVGTAASLYAPIETA